MFSHSCVVSQMRQTKLTLFISVLAKLTFFSAKVTFSDFLISLLTKTIPSICQVICLMLLYKLHFFK